jgi:hypothetical protein
MRFVSGPKDRTSTNRADTARQRRSQRGQERVKTAGSRVVNPVRSRPVTMRANTYGRPLNQQVGTKRARRQFYVTMDQHGAELRLPALPVISPGWRLLSAVVAILAAFGIYSLWMSPFFQAAPVEISGLQRISPDELAGMLSLENLSIVEIDPAAITEEISKAYPELMQIQVAVEMPNFITINAVERQPVLAWLKGDQMTWVDADGVLFPARGDAGPLVTIESEYDLPRAPLSAEEIALLDKTAEAEAVAQAEEEAAKPGMLARLFTPTEKAEPESEPILEQADPTLMTAALDLSKKLPPETSIVYEQDHGLGWIAEQGWQVYIGRDLVQFEDKLALYQAISSHLAEQGIQPVLVSVEHLNAPFYRVEQ